MEVKTENHRQERKVRMFATEGFDLWWMIPLILIALCLFCARGCCAGRRHRFEERHHPGDERRDEMTTEKETTP